MNRIEALDIAIDVVELNAEALRKSNILHCDGGLSAFVDLIKCKKILTELKEELEKKNEEKE